MIVRKVISAAPIERCIDMLRTRAARPAEMMCLRRAKIELNAEGITALHTALQHVLIELTHAVEEGRQDVLMSNPPDEDFKVAIPEGGMSLEEVEKEAILCALRATRYDQREAARILCVTPRVLNYRMAQLKLRPMDRKVVEMQRIG